jgi:TolA-binding protein
MSAYVWCEWWTASHIGAITGEARSDHVKVAIMACTRCLAVVFSLLLVASAAIPASAVEATDDVVSSAAHAKYDSGDLAQAKTLFEEVLREFPNSPLASDAQYTLGWIAHKQKTGQAEKLWEGVVEKYPHSGEAPKALLHIASLHYLSKQPKESRIADHQKVIQLYPNTPQAEEARFRIGCLHKHRPADFDQALATFLQVETTASSRAWRAEAYVESGMTYLQRYFAGGKKVPDDLTKAMTVFSTARAKYPEQADAVSRGEMRQAKYYLYTERDPAKSRQALQAIIKASPESASTTETLYQTAYCSFAEKEYQSCIDQCADIIAKRPPSDWNCYLQYFIGTCFLQIKDKGRARTAFEKAVELYPGTNWAKLAQASLSALRLQEVSP